MKKFNETRSIMNILKQWFPDHIISNFFLNYLPRHYHGIEHIQFMLDLLRDFVPSHQVKNVDAIVLAILFHDYVYYPGSNANEAKSSAALYLAADGRFDQKDLELAQRLILLSPDARTPMKKTGDVKRDSELFMVSLLHDLDYAILGASGPVYLEYCTCLRREFVPSFCDDDAFTSGRYDFLKKLVRNQPLFCLDLFNDKYGKKASANVLMEMYWLKPKEFRLLLIEQIHQIKRLLSDKDFPETTLLFDLIHSHIG